MQVDSCDRNTSTSPSISAIAELVGFDAPYDSLVKAINLSMKSAIVHAKR